MGFLSRKLFVVLLGLALVSAGYLLVVPFPALLALYPTYLGAVIGLVSVYLTGNITNKVMTYKFMPNSSQISTEEDDNAKGSAVEP